MRTPEEVQRLEAAAAAWMGTPFCPDSAVRGSGVCCHRLMAAIYADAGWLTLTNIPSGEAAHARASNTSPMLDWLTGPGAMLFERRDWSYPTRFDADRTAAGDLLLVRFGAIPHHLAMVLSGGNAIHVTPQAGVTLVRNFLVRVPERRILGVWRPRKAA